MMKHSSFVIRPVTRTDIPPLAKLYVELYEILQIGEQWNFDTAHQMLDYYFSHYPDLAFCAESDHQLVGAFHSAIKPWWDGNHLFDGEIFVAVPFQGRGVGRQLLKAVFTAARARYKAVCWDFFTITGKQSPVAWYRKIGIDVPKGYVFMSGNLDKALEHLDAASPDQKN